MQLASYLLRHGLQRTLITFHGFTTIHADRDSDKAQKSVGGGGCMFVSDSWATQYCVRERVCTRDFGLLTVSFPPSIYLVNLVKSLSFLLTFLALILKRRPRE